MQNDLIARLNALLGPKGCTTDPGAMAPHLVEWRGKHKGHSPVLVTPATTAEAAQVVRMCAEAGAAITPQGGNTGLVGGQIPQGEVIVSTRRMNRIRAVDAHDDSLVAEAGATLAEVQNAAAAANRLFPLSLASEGSATIGGLVSTNAGGVHVLRYGMMRDLVLGLEVVLADGRVLDVLNTLRKNNTGYDLKQIFIGAEGTLGLVTAASLKLHPRMAARETAFVGLRDAGQALALLHRVKAQTGAVSAFEVMNRCAVALTVKNVADTRDPLPEAAFMALIEFETAHPHGLRDTIEEALAAALENREAEAVLIAENPSQARDFWALRERLSAGHKPEGAQTNHDISVPVSKTPDFLAKADAAARARCPGVRIVAFGHMGDGNFHYSLLQPEASDAASFPAEALAQEVNATAHELGGSFSAEHGVGVARLDELARFKSPESLALMAAMKRALDPHNVMNPRVLAPTPMR